MSINDEWTNRMEFSHTMEYDSSTKEWGRIHIVDERQEHIQQRKPDTEDYLLYDFVHMNCADKVNL